MENNSLSLNLNDHSIGCRTTIRDFNNSNNNNDNKVKDPWECGHNSNMNYGGDTIGGFSWPPRSYTCSFCKRDFRSAQALGGHMNVHRRDRARLRQSPPTPTDHDQHHPLLNLNLSVNPGNTGSNPYPNFLSSSSPPSCPPTILSVPLFSCSLPSLVSPSPTSSSPSSASPTEMKQWLQFSKMRNKRSTVLGSRELTDEFTGEDHECKDLKKEGLVRLELEIGMVNDSKEEDLDLELRLGYA